MTNSTADVVYHAPRVRTSARPRQGSAIRVTLLSTGFVVAVIAAWQLFASLGWVNTLYTSSPQQIIVTAYHFLPSSEGLNDIRVSAEEFGIGLGASIICGVALGLVMGWFSIFEEITSLGLNIFYSMPLIALAPLLVLWFGIGISSKIAVVFLASLFPILLNTLTGVKNVDATLLNLARAYNASRTQIWFGVLIPGAVSSIITGIRLGMVGALIGVVVGEFIVSSAGLGYLVSIAANNFNITLLFVGLLVIVVIAIVLTFLLRYAERRFSRWRVQ